MKYLITGNLLDEYDWVKSCPKTWKTRAIQNFEFLIKGIDRPLSESQKRSDEFENLVYENCNKFDDERLRNYFEEYFRQKGIDDSSVYLAAYTVCRVISLCKGGKQNVKISKDVVLGGNEYHLCGNADILFPDKIIEIKTTHKYTEGYSYVRRSQHYVYSMCTDINKFEYLVADFNGTKNPMSLKTIEFEMNREENKWVLEQRINDMFNYLKEHGLFEDYCNVFTKKYWK